MNRYLSEEHNLLVEEVRAFAQESIAPIARSADESKDFPWDKAQLPIVSFFSVSAVIASSAVAHSTFAADAPS